MNTRNRNIVIAILIVLVIAGLSIPLLTRSVPPYTPPSNREIKDWGTVDQTTAETLQAILDEEVNTLKVPGIQAYVRTPDGLTWSGTSGTTDLQRHQPMQQEDILRIGSVTKTFTAVVILKQVEAGQLSLDDHLSRWFPGIPGAESITVRNLLNHTSGIEDIIPKGMMKSIIPSTVWQEDELLKLIAGGKPGFTPGSQWAYSNSNYILLGMIAEKVTGKSMLQLYHEEIIDDSVEIRT
jgi:D-alanyl-D-alanine carboxypeptidase